MKSHELAKKLLELENSEVVIKERGDAMFAVEHLEEVDGMAFDNYPQMFYDAVDYGNKEITKLILLG